MIVAAACCFLILLISIYQIIESPEASLVAKSIFDVEFKDFEAIVSIHNLDIGYKIILFKPAYTLLTVFIGAVVTTAVGSVLYSLINGGLKLITLSEGDKI